MKYLELLIVVILMIIPFFLFRTKDFTVFVYWAIITFGYLVYIIFSTKGWVHE